MDTEDRLAAEFGKIAVAGFGRAADLAAKGAPFDLWKAVSDNIGVVGTKGPFAYIVFPGEFPKCYIKNLKDGVLEGPSTEDPYKRIYWDSRNHKITWETQEDVLEAIASAYELMDHKIGQREEWHSEPLYFGDRGQLVVKIDQPRKHHLSSKYDNNATLLTGQRGSYGLRINVGGWGWGEGKGRGITPMGLEECAALQEVYRRSKK